MNFDAFTADILKKDGRETNAGNEKQRSLLGGTYLYSDMHARAAPF